MPGKKKGRASATQGGGNATVSNKTLKNRRKRARAKARRGGSQQAGGRDITRTGALDTASLAFATARLVPFDVERAMGAKLLDFDMNSSQAITAHQEITLPNTAVTYCSGYVPFAVDPLVYSADGTGTTSSATTADFTSTRINVILDDSYLSGGDMSTTNVDRYRGVGGGVRFSYIGAAAQAQGRLLIVPVTGYQYFDYIRNSLVSFTQLQKYPGAIEITLSELALNQVIARFLPVDYTYASYGKAPSDANAYPWIGYLYFATGLSATAGQLKVEVIKHWECIPVNLVQSRATQPAPFRPAIVEAIRAIDEFPDSNISVQSHANRFDAFNASEYASFSTANGRKQASSGIGFREAASVVGKGLDAYLGVPGASDLLLTASEFIFGFLP